nr:hypothetical protein CFP56_53152 [Quercus suber]
MDVDAPPRFGAPGDPNSPPPSPGSANPNPPELAAPIGLGASLPPLSPKQGDKDPSIVWEHFIKLAGSDPNNPREWYGKDKGDVMSSKVRDAMKRLYAERVGQNGASSSSGSSASLSKDSRPSVGNALLSDRIKSYNNRFKQHLADEDSVESKSELDTYLLESSMDPDVEDFDM